jgi:predicted transcriptional regulator
MPTSTNTTTDTVLSVRTSRATRERLQQLAKVTRRTSSSLANDALEQYIAHQDWLAREIERGVQSANKGKLVSDSTITAWIETLER